jgi:hypothetical protein
MNAEHHNDEATRGTMRGVFLVYNQAMDEEILEILEELSIFGLTKWVQVQGRGKTSGSHFDTDIWPGANFMLFIALEESVARELLDRVRELRRSRGEEGVKAFLMPLEDIT